MNTKNIVIGVVAVIAILGAQNLFTEKTPITVVNNIPESPATVVNPIVGSSPGPERSWETECINGLCSDYFVSTLRSGDDDLCSYKVKATSTLVAATLGLTNAAYANVFEIGIGASAGATTTRLGIKQIGSAVFGEVVASTTDSITGLSGNVLIPGYFINFKVSTGTPSSSFAPAGKCSVQTRRII